jgi:F-type H+-transporting ATPase subunit a
MFVIACLLTIAFIWIVKGKVSEDDPKSGQLTLEAGYLYLAGMAESVIGSHGMKYFPVVATFACLILISNLMGQFPLFMSPTASVNVTYALGVSSFIYYNYCGISENGIVNHLKHLAGPKLPWFMFIVTVLIFGIELISNMIRPFTLGVRLFANMYSDEQVFVEITNLAPPFTHFLVPLALTARGVFVAFVQTLVFTLLSMIYLSEVTHEPHGHDTDHPADYEHHISDAQPAAIAAAP